ncbi:hypothetical protein [Arthrobacter sp. SLBN-53]|uniref:hypothetical protein n=1 Tax=Arthrobacter sp. SLBN-53 TaxID=2768412 RepID=UPI001166E558|nr:hypothetical protein [Arthrobacter sp. SLBN-53]TQK28137.1 hypothetical protein FBY28_1109 [Arthrobacter sp. SLBN-53]
MGKTAVAAWGMTGAVLIAGCGGSTAGMATAPDDVSPYTSSAPKRSTTKSPSTRTPTTASPSPGVSQQALDEVRAAGIDGPDDAIADQLSLACIMGESRFNDSVQDVVDVLVQMGSRLPPDALTTIVTVAVKYECPELAAKLGG